MVQQRLSFIIIFPLTFIANTFVPTDNFPPVLQDHRGLEPGLVDHPGRAGAVRQHRPGPAAAGCLAAAAPGGVHVIWVVVLLIVFVPLSVRKYLRTALR